MNTDLATPDRQRWIASEQPTRERRKNTMQPRWKYTDAKGIERTGTFQKSIEGQGTDVTYVFKQDNGTLDLVSGERLKKAERLWPKVKS
jgi:hypothetical protein